MVSRLRTEAHDPSRKLAIPVEQIRPTLARLALALVAPGDRKLPPCERPISRLALLVGTAAFLAGSPPRWPASGGGVAMTGYLILAALALAGGAALQWRKK